MLSNLSGLVRSIPKFVTTYPAVTTALVLCPLSRFVSSPVTAALSLYPLFRAYDYSRFFWKTGVTMYHLDPSLIREVTTPQMGRWERLLLTHSLAKITTESRQAMVGYAKLFFTPTMSGQDRVKILEAIVDLPDDREQKIVEITQFLISKTIDSSSENIAALLQALGKVSDCDLNTVLAEAKKLFLMPQSFTKNLLELEVLIQTIKTVPSRAIEVTKFIVQFKDIQMDALPNFIEYLERIAKGSDWNATLDTLNGFENRNFKDVQRLLIWVPLTADRFEKLKIVHNFCTQFPAVTGVEMTKLLMLIPDGKSRETTDRLAELITPFRNRSVSDLLEVLAFLNDRPLKNTKTLIHQVQVELAKNVDRAQTMNEAITRVKSRLNQ